MEHTFLVIEKRPSAITITAGAHFEDRRDRMLHDSSFESHDGALSSEHIMSKRARRSS